jgi:S1-C subfamily serine protease
MARTILLLTLALVAGTLAARAQDEAAEPWTAAADQLQQATVTVRIWAADAGGESASTAVTVCSGLCIRAGQIITAALPASDTPIRLTLPGGKQADARVQAIDEYSGLALLKADTALLTPLRIGDTLPAVGSELLTAAGWGLEQPLVSRGVVGGVDRKHPGANYPPLLQCDCLTAETSTGSGLVDRRGRLVGVVVAVDRDAGRRNWTYAVPVSHVERLLRAAEDRSGESVVILKRRRPIVGMVLEQNGDAIFAERVTPGGPADKAGIKPGDQVVATEGVAIRSVYQAILPTLYKQPGDTATFRVHREGMAHEVKVVLGGGVELPSVPADLLADLVQPKVRVVRDGERAIVTSRRQAPSPAVAVLPPLPDDRPLPVAPTASDKITLLEKALERYQAVIELQQRQLTDEQKHRQEQEAQLESLRTEIQLLRKAIARPASK